MHKISPYISISGITTPDEVKLVTNSFKEAGYGINSYHQPTIGILICEKSLADRETSAGLRYPALRDLEYILMQSHNKINSSLALTFRDSDSLFDTTKKLFNSFPIGILCKRIQFNVVWPHYLPNHLRQLQKIKERYHVIDILLRFGKEAMETGENTNLNSITNHILNYKDIVSGIVIDPSGGKGKLFDLEKAHTLKKNLNHSCKYINLCLAGGLKPSNIKNVLHDFIHSTAEEDFSIDALSGIRSQPHGKKATEYGEDILDISKTKEFLNNASEILY